MYTTPLRHGLRLAALLMTAALIGSACGGGTDVTVSDAPADATVEDDAEQAPVAEPEAPEPAQEPVDPTPEPTEPDEPPVDPNDPAEMLPEIPPTPEPDEPAPDPEDVPVTESTLVGASSMSELEDDVPPEVHACMVDALLADTDLARKVIFAESDNLLDLDPEAASQVMDLALGCIDEDLLAELITSGFQDGGFVLPPDSTLCFASKFESVDQRRALLELSLAGEDEAMESATVDLVVGALANCVPGEVWIETMGDDLGFGEDEAAVDRVCIGDLFTDELFLRGFFDASVEGDLDDVATPAALELFGRVFECVNFGEVMAAEAALDGVVLSDEAIACLNDAIREPDLLAAMLSDAPDDEAMGALILGCFTAEDFAAMANS